MDPPRTTAGASKLPLDSTTGIGVILYAALLYLPGRALLRLLGVRHGDAGVTVALALGLGMALQPLIYLWADVAGLTVGAGWTWALLLVSGAVELGGLVRRGLRSAGWWRSRSLRPASFALLATTAAVLGSRWGAARDLAVPRWGDSVHHTIMVDLFMRRHGLPHDWRPYADLSTFTYHFGLHAQTASVAWLSGLPPHRALILVGQMLSVVGVVTAYGLASGLGGGRWAGVLAGLAAGGMSVMPAYYLNWGRYTQLAGQALVPAAALLTVAAASRRSWRLGAAAAVAVAGLALTHYVVTAFFAAFVVAWLVVMPPPAAGWLIADRNRGPAGDRLPTDDERGPAAGPLPATSDRRPAGGRTSGPIPATSDRRSAGDRTSGPIPATSDRRSAGDRLRATSDPGRTSGPTSGLGRRAWVLPGLTGVGLAALLVDLPWVPRFLAGPLGSYALTLSTDSSVDPGVFGVMPRGMIWQDFRLHVGLLLAGAFLAGTAVALLRGARFALVGTVWVALLLLASRPWLLALPVVGVIKDFTVSVGLYLPASLAVAGLAVLLPQPPAGRREVRGAWGLAAVLAIFAAVLAWKDARALVPGTELVTDDDLAAFDWVRGNTPPDAVFLASTFPAFGDTVVAGDDAGWWLTYFTGRRSTLPPITVGLERSAEPGYRESLNELSRQWHADIDSPATEAALDAHGVTYAFVGEVARRNDEAGMGQGLYGRLVGSPDWEPVHAVGGAAVFRRGAGAAGAPG